MTGIEWTQRTWNPTVGCSRVSPGCDGCYAIGVAHRAMQPAHQGLTIVTDGGPDWTGDVRRLPERLTIPLQRRPPTTWFVDSMSDLFHPGVPNEFITQVWAVMAQAERHTFQVLTKRPQRMASFVTDRCRCIPETGSHVDGVHLRSAMSWAGTPGSPDHVPGVDGHAVYHQRPWPLSNVWLGTSIESDRYTWRADHLRDTPAAVRFLSLEPLLGPLPSLDLTGIDWVIAGGESGPRARPMHPNWVRDIRDRCADAGVAFFFKQWGAWAWTYGGYPSRAKSLVVDDGTGRFAKMWRVGKTAAGHDLDGRVWQQLPGDRA